MGHEEVCSRQSNDADVHAQLVHVHVFFHACPKCFSFEAAVLQRIDHPPHGY